MKALFKFYASCALSNLGDRLWYFALSMYFVTINDNNLMMTALNGFVCNVFSILLGAQIGSQIDKYPRLNVIKFSLLVQNSTVALNCLTVTLILLFKDFAKSTWNGALLYVAQAFMILLNIISNAGSTASKISMEKDWVIVIAEHVDKQNKPETDEIVIHEQNTENTRRFTANLTHINAIVRRIDLFTSVLAPLLAGLIMSFIQITPSFNGTVISAIFFAVWNLISYGIEFSILKSVHNDVPSLAIKKLKRFTQKSEALFCRPAVNLYRGWSTYMKQGPSLMPSLALSMLFLTVLSFDSITLGYAKSQNLTELSISIFQAVGSVTGVLGTFAFEILHCKFKVFLPMIGIIGTAYQLFFLFICFVAIWLPGSPFVLADIIFSTAHNNCNLNGTFNSSSFQNSTHYELNSFEDAFFLTYCNPIVSILTLLSAMALSRTGLWLTDLVVNQIIQENVDEKDRGVVGGVQQSINQIFDLLKFTSVIFLSDVNQYGYLVMISVGAVFISFCFYLVYAIKQIINKYSQVPTNDSGPFRKSMIQMKVISNNNDIQEQNDDNDSDSFDEKK